MKKIILAAMAAAAFGLAAATVAPTFVQAAPGGAHAGKGGARLKKMADALGLTDAQKAQMKPIVMGARQQAKAIQDDTTLTPEAKTAKLKELRRSTTQQMMAILTPEQRTKLKAMRAERREAKQGKG